MKHVLCWLIAASCLYGFSLAQSPNSPPRLVIQDVAVIDATGSPAQLHRTVVVGNRIIQGIDPAETYRSLKDDVIVNGQGRFLIPGLWDMHVHMVFGDWFPHGKEITLPLFIANGVTGVRDMGGELEVLQRWRTEISA